MSMRIYSPSPTVPVSRTPLYLMGISDRVAAWHLGQDTIDTSAPDLSTMFEPVTPEIPTSVPIVAPDFGAPSFSASPGFLDTTPPELQPLIAQGFTPDQADLISSAAANGLISQDQFNQILTGQIPPSAIADTVFAGYTPTTGPTPPSRTQAQAQAAAAAMASSIAQATKTASTLLKPTTPGPSPRVGIPGATPSIASVFSQPAVGGLSVGMLLIVGLGFLLVMRK